MRYYFKSKLLQVTETKGLRVKVIELHSGKGKTFSYNYSLNGLKGNAVHIIENQKPRYLSIEGLKVIDTFWDENNLYLIAENLETL